MTRLRMSSRRAPRAQSAASICFLPGGWRRPRSTGCDAVPTRTPLRSTRIAPGRQRFACRVVDRHRSELDPQVADHGPRPGVRCDSTDPPIDDVGGQVPAHAGVVDGDLRCDGDAVGRLGYRRQRPVVDAVQRGLQQRRTRNRQPVKQIPRGVGGPDRLGHDAVDRPGVQGGFDLKRGGTGDRVTGRDRRLHRRGAAPRGQQREVQVDPAVRPARRADRREAAPRMRPRRRRLVPIPPTPRRIRPSWGVTAATPGCRGRAPVVQSVTATAWPGGRRRRLAESGPRRHRGVARR